LEIKQKADQAIRGLVQALMDSQTLVKTAVNQLEQIGNFMKDPMWRYGMSRNEDNVAENYANAIQDVVGKLRTHAAEIEGRDVDWDFNKL
jgi:hypothetical protein